MNIKNISELKENLKVLSERFRHWAQESYDNLDKETLWQWGKPVFLVVCIVFVWFALFNPFKSGYNDSDELAQIAEQDQEKKEPTGHVFKKDDSSDLDNILGVSDEGVNDDGGGPKDTGSDSIPSDPLPSNNTTPIAPRPPVSPNPSSNLKTNGSICSLSSECRSGFCVDGYCCDSSCDGSCQRCDGFDGVAGTCTNVRKGSDPDNECTVGEYNCAGKCKMSRSDGTCSGAGSCDIGSDVVYMKEGHVCVEGVETPVSKEYFCFRGNDCNEGDCMANAWYTACDGKGTCLASTNKTNAFIETIVAENSFTLTDNCELQGLTYCKVADTGRCSLGGCSVAREAFRCRVAEIDEEDSFGDKNLADSVDCSLVVGMEYESCPQGTACGSGECNAYYYCDGRDRYYADIDDYCKSGCNGSGLCNVPTFCEKSYKVVGLPSELKVYTNTQQGERDVDIARIPQKGKMPISIWKGDVLIATINVDFNDRDLNWSNLKADVLSGSALLHYEGGISNLPGIDSDSYTLFIPSGEGEQVAVCPGVSKINDVEGACDDIFYLKEGDFVKNAKQAVSLVNIEGTDYWSVPGLSGTGAFTLAGIKNTCNRLQVSQLSNHEIRFMPTYPIDSSTGNIVVNFTPTQITTDGTQDFDMASITLNDISLVHNGVAKTLGALPGVGIWGASIDDTDDVITFSAPTNASTGEIEVGSTVYVRVGSNAGGTNQITNPSVANSYKISVRLNNGSNEDFGLVEIPIVDDDTVNVHGYIDTLLTFDIDTSYADANCDATGVSACNSHSGILDGSGYVVSLGEMSINNVNRSGLEVLHADGTLGNINYIWFDIETNANSGAVVTMQSLNGGLQKDTENIIDMVSSGSEVLISPASGLYGLNHRSSFLNNTSQGLLNVYWNCDCSLGDSYYCRADNLLPSELFNTNGAPVNGGRLQIAIGASPSATNSTGTYTDQLTFIATATF